MLDCGHSLHWDSNTFFLVLSCLIHCICTKSFVTILNDTKLQMPNSINNSNTQHRMFTTIHITWIELQKVIYFTNTGNNKKTVVQIIYICTCLHLLASRKCFFIASPRFTQLLNHSSPQCHPVLATIPYTLYSASKHKSAHKFNHH